MRQLGNVLILCGYLLGGAFVGGIVGAWLAVTTFGFSLGGYSLGALILSGCVQLFSVVVAGILGARRCWPRDPSTRK